MWPSHILQPPFWRAAFGEAIAQDVLQASTGFYTLAGRSVALHFTQSSTIQYSIGNAPFAWINLPVPRFGSDYKKVLETNIEQETYGGVVYVHRLSTRRQWNLVFRVTESHLSLFETLHADVDGRANPFYFRFGTVTMYCRKEAGFAPRMLETPTNEPMYDYVLTLTEEVVPVAIG